ncbi:MAG TPA: iron-containing alcohol dehydrogenase [Victivallales bacterium]|nr:iron-containing alcohol dehydrogenase [Victivallales bacterium]
MNNSFSISGVPKLIFGNGKIDILPDILKSYGNNILLITGGSSLIKSGNYSRIQYILTDFNIFEAVISSEPSPDNIDSIVFDNMDKSISAVCSIGGGSVLDAGKAVSAMLKEDDFKTVADYLEGVGSRIPTGRKIPFVAVPTTSGTGSEATKNAVISHVGKKGFKKSLRHDNYIPDIAVIDPKLIINCPENVTSASGLDALSQLMESYISTKSSCFTDSLALGALERVLKCLEKVCLDDPDNIELRGTIAYGAFVSGITLAHAGLGTVHGLAGVIGGYTKIPHGAICGLLLPHWFGVTVDKMLQDKKFYRDKIIKLERLSEYALPLEKHSIKNLVIYIQELSDKLKLHKLSSYGVTERDLKLFAEKGGNKNNPVELNAEERLGILEKAY